MDWSWLENDDEFIWVPPPANGDQAKPDGQIPESRKKAITKRKKAAHRRPREKGREAFFRDVYAFADRSERMKPDALRERYGHAFLGNCALVDWIIIDQTDDGILLKIDEQLRDLIADYHAGKNLPETTGVGALARRLRDGLKSREEDFDQQRKAANWTGHHTLSNVFERWLVWIKSELDAVLKD